MTAAEGRAGPGVRTIVVLIGCLAMVAPPGVLGAGPAPAAVVSSIDHVAPPSSAEVEAAEQRVRRLEAQLEQARAELAQARRNAAGRYSQKPDDDRRQAGSIGSG